MLFKLEVVIIVDEYFHELTWQLVGNTVLTIAEKYRTELYFFDRIVHSYMVSFNRRNEINRLLTCFFQ